MFILIILTLISVSLASNTTSLPQNCGKSISGGHNDWYIIGGTDADVGEFPWQVLLSYARSKDPDDVNICGGAIINERWILTAGHCISLQPKNTEFIVRLGVHNESIQENTEIVSFAEKIIEHENFSIKDGPANDIALIKLNVTLDFGSNDKNVAPICLAKSNTKLTNKCVATGWGITSRNGRYGPANGILKKVDMPLLDDFECKNASSVSDGMFFNESMEVCAGGLKGKSTCSMDSGGPLQCQGIDGRWYQLGITSFGFADCGEEDWPAAFTKISAYIDWIQHTISQN